jgi:transcriptional regulator with XRE-family HTH domain
MDAQTIVGKLTEAGVTQVEIAEYVGLDQSGVSRIESGKRKRISYDVGVKLMELYLKRKRKRANGVAA